MEKRLITVTVSGLSLRAEQGIVLSELLNNEKPCGGRGSCGKCRVTVSGDVSPVSDRERELLTAEELSRGIRLSCLTRALGDCTVEYTDKGAGEILTDSRLPDFDLSPAFSRYGAVVDIGTTTLAARLYGTDGRLLAEAADRNPQTALGADVVTRVELSLKGEGAHLAELILGALDRLLTSLSYKAGIPVSEIDGAVITGNTVMLSLLVKESTEPFSHAPFAAERLFGETLCAGELGLSSLTPDTQIYLPPCISAFVGADTVCAIIATELDKREHALLADVGTNGEIVLSARGRLFASSTAAGPAFEGAGIEMGMRGTSGAIDKVYFNDGSIQVSVIGGGEAVGICGSGIVDAVACLLEAELIEESGYLEDERFNLTDSVYITQKDIRMLQSAKSAIAAGITTLLQSVQDKPTASPELLVAGGFGSYLNFANAVRIGLIPSSLSESAEAVGNCALGGASMLLLSQTLRDKARRIADTAELVELSGNPIFSESYMMGMLLAPTEE